MQRVADVGSEEAVERSGRRPVKSVNQLRIPTNTPRPSRVRARDVWDREQQAEEDGQPRMPQVVSVADEIDRMLRRPHDRDGIAVGSAFG